ncbi:unnamed protein product [Darwinula stevensoni]|uniref:diacylglycerol O-acyltransferase n=1 Tax=Darwinula stevensoni TaxID=69355 RepID=A0A7R9AHH9_9CRUS|nr:unnamed protein product [Darwinula stevensoni]CAG0904773.1 unnamed protein product [Darwinula stevensoni]
MIFVGSPPFTRRLSSLPQQPEREDAEGPLVAAGGCGHEMLWAWGVGRSLVTWVVLLPLVLGGLALRVAVAVALRARARAKGRRMRMMPAHDVIYCTELNHHSEPVSLVMTLAGAVEAEGVKDRVVEALERGNPQVREKLGMFVDDFLGFKIWCEESDFSVDDHVLCLPPARDEWELDAVVAALPSTTPEGRSPWCIYVVPLSSSAQTALVFRFHHCLGDAQGILRGLVRRLLDSDTSWTSKENKVTSELGLMRQLFALFLLPSLTADTVFLNPWRMAKKLTRRKLEPDHVQVLAHSEPIPLSTISAVKRATGATVNDVFTAAVQHILDADRRAFVVSLRRNTDETMSNVTTVKRSHAPSHPSPDSLRYLTDLKTTVDKEKSSVRINAMYMAETIYSTVTPIWLLKYLVHAIRSVDYTTSNVNATYLGGQARLLDKEISALYFIGPYNRFQENFVMLTTFGNSGRLSLRARQEVVKDAREAKNILNNIVKWIEDLHSRVQGRPPFLIRGSDLSQLAVDQLPKIVVV